MAVSELPVDMSEGARHDEILRSASLVSGALLLSRVSGLVRETVMAHLFGAGRIYDAFSLGFRIPNLIRDLFAEGALSSAFVPVFSEYLSTKGRKEAAQLANLVGTAVILIVGALCILGIIFSPALVGLLAPGWEAADPGKFALAISLTRTMFPFLLLVALAAQAMGVLNACNRFGVPALASTLFNIGSVVFGVLLALWLGPRFGIPAIQGMAYGVVLGGALQLLWQIPAMRSLGFRFRPGLDWSHPGLQRIIRMMVPAIIGSAAVQVNVAVNTNFASTIVDPVRGLNGPVSWLQFAFRFMQLPLGLFGVAIASATLPAISRSVVTGKIDEFRRTLSNSIGTVLLLTVPSSVGLIILGRAMIGTIYEGRKFEAYDTQQTAVALSCYAIGLAGYAAIKVLAPAFYALGSARVPMLREHRLYRDQLFCSRIDDPSVRARTGGSRAGNIRGLAVRLRFALLVDPQPHWRHLWTAAASEHSENRACLCDHGRCRGAFKRVHGGLARRIAARPGGRPRDIDPAWSRRVLERVPDDQSA